MMVLIRLSEIFIITGSLEALLAPSHNKSSSSSTYCRSSLNIPPSGRRKRVIGPYPNPDSPLYLLKVKSLLGPMPGIFLASLPSLKASLYSDCEWINLLLIEYVSLLQRGENLRQMLLMEPSRARFLLVCSHPSPPSLPRWFLPFHRRIFSSCDRQAFYKQIMSFSLTLFETWMSESLEEKTVS